ncbi:MAG: SHOCT domain-containing protein [Chloroflexi bacterium]|nr:SHOCT domain-containing protein [Chloroflexota bacterium]
MWYFDGFGWWMVLGAIWMIIFWGAIIGLVIWAVTRLTRRSDAAGRSPIDIARERYAKGELTREQFEEIKRDLS